MVYALFSQGFRPGGVQPLEQQEGAQGRDGRVPVPGAERLRARQPEQLRGRPEDRALRPPAAAQSVRLLHGVAQRSVLSVRPRPSTSTPPSASTARTTTIKGVELQAVARPIDGLTLQGSVSYNDDTQSVSPCLKDNIAGTADFGQCITQAQAKGDRVHRLPQPVRRRRRGAGLLADVAGQVRSPATTGRWASFKPFVQGGVHYVGSMFNQPATYPSGNGVLDPDHHLPALQPAVLHDAGRGGRRRHGAGTIPPSSTATT